MSELNFDKDEVNAILSRWNTIVYKARSHNANADLYQRGEAAAYEAAVDDLERLIKKHNSKIEGKINSINNTYKTRKLVIERINNIIVVPLFIFFIFMIFAKLYSLSTLITLIICAYWLLTKQWINGKPLASQAIALLVGLLLVIFTKVGTDTISVLSQVTAVVGGQILGGAFVGFLLLVVKKPRESKVMSVLLSLLFVVGFITVLRFQPDLTKGSLLDTTISVIGIIGSETLGAGITVSLIGSWLDDEID